MHEQKTDLLSLVGLCEVSNMCVPRVICKSGWNNTDINDTNVIFFFCQR